MPRVVRGQGRDNTFKLFSNAVGQAREGELPLLLVDSEGPVVSNHSVWQHLHSRDKWAKPPAAREDQAFLMVQLMETWFLADRDLLRRYFGPDLRENHLREWPSLEAVPKSDVLRALERATAGCDRSYAKGRVSFRLLEDLDPAKVENACPHASALLERLREIG